MFPDPNKQVMERAYARWVPVYDTLCGPVFVNGRRAAAQAARAVGGCILEIGVGTGLSFGDYNASTEITGIDISEPMIARGCARLSSGRYPYVKELTVMDAAALTFPDGTFDCVVGQFVITLVENPERSPRDLIGATAVGCLDEDLRNACLAALACERAACREFAIGMSWERSARAFVEHVTTAAAARQLAA